MIEESSDVSQMARVYLTTGDVMVLWTVSPMRLMRNIVVSYLKAAQGNWRHHSHIVMNIIYKVIDANSLAQPLPFIMLLQTTESSQPKTFHISDI